MATTREKQLREHTNKGEFEGDVDELPRRVFQTLRDDKGQQAHRNSTAIALLVEHLHKKKLLTDDELDDLLLKVVGDL